jgi:hypothetical protein
MSAPGKTGGTEQEALRVTTKEMEEEIQGYLGYQASAEPQANRAQPPRQGGNHHRWKLATMLARWADREWQRRWNRRGARLSAATWHTPWPQQILKLYEGLQKHEATALFLLRTEVLGLNAWLASIGVPGVLPRCPCETHAQTVRHILLHCPDTAALRPQMIVAAPSETLQKILSHPQSARAAARLLISSGLLAQFHLAHQIHLEGPSRHSIPDLDDWPEITR